MGNRSRTFRLVVNKTPQPHPPVSGVYLITDQGDNLVERVRSALRGGVTLLQYRAKNKDPDLCRREGAELKDLCREFGVSFIVNDDLHLARDLDADGVHLGQDDGDIAAARAFLGPDRIVGASTHNLEEALRAEQEGADYIGFGAMYPSSSKAVVQMPGIAGLSVVKERVRLPVVAIGGITTGNACRVIDAGADALAVISSVLSGPRPEMTVAELKLLFNRKRPWPRGAVLTVAGSDSGGGAGIQADLKTITLLGSYGASVLTALTAQNTRGVASIHGLPPSFVADQLDAVLSDIPIDVIKTGMLHTAAVITTLAERLAERRTILPLIVDPVMIAKGGASLLDRDAVRALSELLLPDAYLVTPNIPEAERLLGMAIRTEADMEEAARRLHALGPANVLIKGGHLTGPHSTDILFNGQEYHRIAADRIFTCNTHGTGCTFSSAIAAFLARGEPLRTALERAKEFVTTAIRLARPLGKGHSPVNHCLAARELLEKGKPS
jgi:hydroxymethylpyrimidine kinase/phosphomethylpyrimidine kinase/thiamine-phosphate diphosphorylase